MKKALPTFLILCLFAFIFIVQSYDYTRAKTSRPTYLYPNGVIEHITFGYNEPLSDSLWIRVIQDFDICDQRKKTDVSAQELVEHSLCNKGWVYSVLDAVTQLSPRNELPYIIGGTILSVLVDDREGARLIFEKGVHALPNDWSIAYRAAYHYLYEVKDNQRAAELLEHAGRHGAPPWVFALSARLYTDLGRAELGISILEDALQRDYKGYGTERLKERLTELKKIRDEALKNQK